ncbi:MerR family transcriptional regulator [Gordonia soli]|uniref:Putative MerR family transcriptional regulator n=1 Tax=Gordonia soli NBRC 108243 TaxID=1223545 RepID=M0QQ93_9ACTN|nr:MerR family transcriptional regulator [Gordonia soli]GAC69622.1 putative MerR family transcriptional regulator [Gordonia soli NBRC 108243]
MPRPTQTNRAVLVSALERAVRSPARVGRQSREVEATVTRLVDSAVRQARGERPPTEYRIDELARAAGTTTRNVRAYRERGLLPPPRRVGRLALYSDDHLGRLKLIGSMLERGYTSAHIDEMLTALRDGRQLSDILGVETEVADAWADGTHQMISRSEFTDAGFGPAELARLADLGLLVDDSVNTAGGPEATGEVRVRAPELVEPLLALVDGGVPPSAVLDIAERFAPVLTDLGRAAVQSGVDLSGIPDDQTIGDADLVGLVTAVLRLRALATAALSVTMRAAIREVLDAHSPDDAGHRSDPVDESVEVTDDPNRVSTERDAASG